MLQFSINLNLIWKFNHFKIKFLSKGLSNKNTYQYFIKDWEKAEFYYGKVLELRPDHPQAYQGLIDLYRYNWPGRKSQVEPLLLAAIKNDPENKLPYNISLVEFFADENDAAKAKIYLENVRELDESQVPELVETYPILK